MVPILGNFSKLFIYDTTSIHVHQNLCVKTIGQQGLRCPLTRLNSDDPMSQHYPSTTAAQPPPHFRVHPARPN